MVRIWATVTIAAGLAMGGPGAAAGEAQSQTVELHATDSSERAAPPPVLDELADGDVLRITVDGGQSGAHGQIRQCERTVDGFASCTNPFPVLFDDEGVAIFQYQLVDSGRCSPTATCVVVVTDDDRERTAYAYLVFGAPAQPAPTVSLAPSGPYDPSARVDVTVSGLAPGATAVVSFCALRCYERIMVTADDVGLATASVVIGGRCSECGIRVVSGQYDTSIDVTFTPLPSPSRSPGRVVIGLLLAATLLAIAWRTIATHDWRPPSEAATPEFDAITLGHS